MLITWTAHLHVQVLSKNKKILIKGTFLLDLGRGRPPKNSHNETHTSNFVAENQEFDIGNPDSPPKAKRKSRPPRRHKPDEDLIQSSGHASTEQYAETYQTEEFNVTLSSLDPSGLPTVENIHKFFSRGRGKYQKISITVLC